MIDKISRRLFLKTLALFVYLMTRAKFAFPHIGNKDKKKAMPGPEKISVNIGVDEDIFSRVYIARGRAPEDNMKNAIQLMGGIEKFIYQKDIVVIKPNAQWWNQGTTNTNNMKGFIESVLDIPGFSGEIIIAENHHYKIPNSRGWTTGEKNGDYNLNELVQHFNDMGHMNVSKYHWIDGGPNPDPKQGDAAGGSIVDSVEEGDGYVWLKDTVYISPENRKCMMTYPVFTSRYSGKKIDLMKGSFRNGKYINNVKFINFSCLNHHSYAFGITASIKNLMGVVDMTCGFQGTEPEGFYNTHFIGNHSLLYQVGTDLKYYGKKYGFGAGFGSEVLKFGYWNTQYSGGALGYWIKTVRAPDLNILAAEYVGWGGRGRNGPHKRSNTNCVLISTDPVALDYIGAKNVLLSVTPESERYYSELNDPDNPPSRLFFEECHAQGIGNIDKDKIKVIEDA